MIFNNSTSSNTTSICASLFSGRRYLDEIQINILISFNAVIMISNLVANLAVVYALLSTKQLRNVSMRLILYLSISDCSLAFIGQPLFIVMMTEYLDSSNCTFETVIQVVIVSSAHISGYIIILIAWDRYVRMKYLQSNSVVIKSWKVHVSVVIVLFLSFLEGVIHAIGTTLEVFADMNIVQAITDILLMFVVFVAYMKTIIVIKKQKNDVNNHHDVLVNLDHVITRLVSKMIVAGVVCYVPYIALTILRPSIIDKANVENRKWLHFALFLSYELIFSNASANALIFLSSNKKSRSKLIQEGATKLRIVRSSVVIRSVNSNI